MQSYATHGKDAYFTLANGDHMNKVHTCGDIVRGQAHFFPPQPDCRLTHFAVSFKCKARTLVTVGSGNDRRTYKTKVYLFNYHTQYIWNLTPMPSHKSFDFKFTFPWTIQPDPTQHQFSYGNHPHFAMGPNTPLPPTFSQFDMGNQQSILYYLEIVAVRSGKFMSHDIKDQMPLMFSHPRINLNPRQDLVFHKARIVRESRLLDPKKRDEPYGLKERTKHLFSSHDPHPTATFDIHGYVPNSASLNHSIPVIVDLKFITGASTAPEQPKVEIRSIYVRLTSFTTYRVSRERVAGIPTMRSLFGGEIMREHYEKVDICKENLGSIPIESETRLNDFVRKIGIGGNMPPSFQSPTISRHYVIKVSAKVVCAEKSFDVELGKHPFLLLPDVHRPLPGQQGPRPPLWEPTPSFSRMNLGNEKSETNGSSNQAPSNQAPPRAPQQAADEELPPPTYQEALVDPPKPYTDVTKEQK